jgi:hypothetical protein
VVDAKFPCPSKISNTKPGQTMAQPSNLNVPGTQMLTSKEKVDYMDIDGVEQVHAMTPKDAQEIKSDCNCEGT